MKRSPLVMLVAIVLVVTGAGTAGAFDETHTQTAWYGDVIKQTTTVHFDLSTCSGNEMAKPRTMISKWNRYDSQFSAKNIYMNLGYSAQPCGGIVSSDKRVRNITTVSYGVNYTVAGSAAWPFVSTALGTNGGYTKAKIYRGALNPAYKATICAGFDIINGRNAGC